MAVVFTDIKLVNAELASEQSKTFATNRSYRTTALAVDVFSEKSMDSMLEKAVEAFGRIDYAVSIAGGKSMLHLLLNETKEIDDSSFTDWRAAPSRGSRLSGFCT